MVIRKVLSGISAIMDTSPRLSCVQSNPAFRMICPMGIGENSTPSSSYCRRTRESSFWRGTLTSYPLPEDAVGVQRKGPVTGCKVRLSAPFTFPSTTSSTLSAPATTMFLPWAVPSASRASFRPYSRAILSWTTTLSAACARTVATP